MKDILRLEGTTDFFGRLVPAHRNLGSLAVLVAIILFWVFIPVWYALGLDKWPLAYKDGMFNIILFCALEAFLRGAWMTFFLREYALFYVLISLAIVPLTAPLWVWIYGWWNPLFFVFGMTILLSAAAGNLLTRALQRRISTRSSGF